MTTEKPREVWKDKGMEREVWKDNAMENEWKDNAIENEWLHKNPWKPGHEEYSYSIQTQSLKILLLPAKYEIIMVPSNHSFFKYCDSYIGLFSIAPCKVIILNPLCILFGISSLLLF